MLPAEQVVSFTFQEQHLGIFKQGVNWIFIVQNTATGERKGTLCVCFEQASELMDKCIERMKVWVN